MKEPNYPKIFAWVFAITAVAYLIAVEATITFADFLFVVFSGTMSICLFEIAKKEDSEER